jgi:HK97 family phage major capsid protein
MSTKLFDLRKQRAETLAKAEALVETAEKENRVMTSTESELFDVRMAAVKDLNVQVKSLESTNTLGALMEKYGPTAFMDGLHDPSQGAQDRAASPAIAKRLMEDLSCFYRGQEIMAADTPLLIGSGGLSGTVPTQVLSAVPSYYNLDSFALAGATIIPTDNTDPLVLPVVGAGAAPDAFNETQSSTESHPMVVDTFTFGGDKHSRLVKATDEAIMNSALNLPNAITGELTASVATGFTAVVTAAMEVALKANSACLVDSGSYDPYGSVVALIDAVPPRWADASNCFMGSRAMRTILRNARAVDSGLPLLDPKDDTILGHKYVVNDSVTRLIYGNFSAGAWIRKSPFFLQILLEAFTATGERGFKATQWIDQHFLAEKSTIVNQPLYYTHLDTAGS